LNLRLTAAVAVGKLLIMALRVVGRAGTTLPGRVALALAPDLISEICRAVDNRIVVTGTNGKTTTSAMLDAVFRSAGQKVVRNVSGANLASGVASSLIEHATLAGHLLADILILELDEAAIPSLAPQVRPRLAVVTNLFRDQLDRFGELDRTATFVRRSLASAREVACLNADDPQVAGFQRSLPDGCRPVMYGVELSAPQQRPVPEHGVGVDVQYCFECGARFFYDFTTYGHLGHYTCPQCSSARPSLHVMGLITGGEEAVGGRVQLRLSGELAREAGVTELEINLRVPGIYNIYNALAAAAAAVASGVAAEDVRAGLEAFTGAFGRMERVQVSSGEFSLALVKNPAGFNEVLRTVQEDAGDKVLVLAVNDHAADGRDISWLWDVQFAQFSDSPEVSFISSGLRAHDMAVRLKYAQVPRERITVVPEPSAAVEAALDSSGGSAEVFVLCTYTAMLSLRSELSSRGAVPDMWKGVR